MNVEEPLIDRLSRSAQADRERLWPSAPITAVERWMDERQEQAVRAGIDLLMALTEPWRASSSRPQVLSLILRLHLYARILDDAVDEGLPAHREKALLAQPLLWEVATSLGQHWPKRCAEATILIKETVQAAQLTEENTAINLQQQWAHKNHHLLIAPLLLVSDTDEFLCAKPLLSRALFLFQAREEQEQPHPPETSLLIIRSLDEWLAADDWRLLHEGGWTTLAKMLKNTALTLLQTEI